MFHYFGSGQNRRSHHVLGGFVLTLLQLAWILGMGLSPVSECSSRPRSASKSINQARARAGARSLLLILTHKSSGRPNLVQCMLAGWLAGGCTWMERWAVIFACVLYIAGFFFSFLLVFGLWQLESAGAPLSSGFFFPPTQTTVQSPNCFT